MRISLTTYDCIAMYAENIDIDEWPEKGKSYDRLAQIIYDV